MNKLVKRSFLNALATILYVSIIGTILRNADKIFAQQDNFSSPIIFLLVFVLSAAITGSLILGKPVLMYIDGNKAEAVKLFFYTLGWLALAVVILLLVNLKY